MYRQKMFVIFTVFIVGLIGFFIWSSNVIADNAKEKQSQDEQTIDYNKTHNSDKNIQLQDFSNNESKQDSFSAQVDTSGTMPVIREQSKKTVNIGTNYLHNAARTNNLVLWNTETFPLRVAIDSSEVSDPTFVDAVRNGFSNWQSASENFVTFLFVNNASQANIAVKLTSQFDCTNNKEVGSTHFSYDRNNLLYQAEVVIPLNDCNGKTLSADQIMRVAQHQAGHALGIAENSSSMIDVMNSGFLTSRYNVSSSDVYTLKLLYKFKADVTNKPYTAAQEQQLLNPADIKGQSDYAIHQYLITKLSNEASKDPLDDVIADANKYYAQKDYSRALAYYKRGLSMATDDKSVTYIYYSMAVININQKDYDSAFDYAMKAYEKSPEPINAYLVAYTNYYRGKTDRAQEQLEYIVNNYPNFKNAYPLLGNIYLKNKEIDKLKSLAEKAKTNFGSRSPIKIK